MTLTRVERRLQAGVAGEARESIGLESSNPYIRRRHLSNAPSRSPSFLISNHVSVFSGEKRTAAKYLPCDQYQRGIAFKSKLNKKSFTFFTEDVADDKSIPIFISFIPLFDYFISDISFKNSCLPKIISDRGSDVQQTHSRDRLLF